MVWWLSLTVMLIAFKIYQKVTCGMCKSKASMKGKVVIVTGANTGIGYETAKDMARRGARVILACRSSTRGGEARDNIIEATANTNVVYKHLDLSSLASVRSFSDDIIQSEQRLDVLINNAGAAGLGQTLTPDGLIIEMQISHFSPFLLTNLLLPILKSSTPSRIINVSSIAHWIGTSDLRKLFKKDSSEILFYAKTKLCNILFTNELSRRLKGSGVVANSLHPGSVRSNIYRNGNMFLRACSACFNNLFFKNELEGAQTLIYLAVSPECENITGIYFADCKPARVSWKAKNPKLDKELWDKSARLVNIE